MGTDLDKYQILFPADWAIASVPLTHQVGTWEDLRRSLKVSFVEEGIDVHR